MVNECTHRVFNAMTLQKKLLNVGNYKFTGKKLGKGNFARVEEAVHSLLNVKVAVKIMDVNQIKEDYIIKNLQREARIMSQLHHPCISAIFQTMQNGNLYYLVTELIGGGDLCTFIKSQKYGKLEERSTRIYARQLISALAHMHNLGIVHRDLKMENVMMNSMQTQIKIVDFGLSNAYNPDSPLRTHCGSPEYAAPELFVPGKFYGPEVDLWSLGVILFGMVAGQLPFVVAHEENLGSQERRKKLLVQINKGYSTTQRKIMSLASSDFRAMISKMLVADAMKRTTVNELLFDTWITEKGRKAVTTNPLKQMAGDWQISIMKQVSTLLRLDLNSVQNARATEPRGDVAGIYNILAYKIQDQRLQGDGVTKTVQPQRTIMTTERKESPVSVSSKKRIERVKSPCIHKIQKVSAEITRRPATAKRLLPPPEKRPKSTVCPTRARIPNEVPLEPVLQPIPQQKAKENKSIFAVEARRCLHSTQRIREQLLYLKEQFIHPPPEPQQNVATPVHKPRLNSASLQRRLQHLGIKTQAQHAQASPSMCLTESSSSYATNPKNEVQVVGSKGIAKVLLEKKTAIKKSIKSSLRSNKSNSESVMQERLKNKSESTTHNKPAAAASSNLVRRYPKTSRVIPVMGNPSDSKVTTTPTSKNQSTQRSNRRPATTKPGPRDLEKSHLAQGDGARRRSSSATATKPTPLQRTILSDPIARSIAGYLVRTIPNKPQTAKSKNARSKVVSAV